MHSPLFQIKHPLVCRVETYRTCNQFRTPKHWKVSFDCNSLKSSIEFQYYCEVQQRAAAVKTEVTPRGKRLTDHVGSLIGGESSGFLEKPFNFRFNATSGSALRGPFGGTRGVPLLNRDHLVLGKTFDLPESSIFDFQNMMVPLSALRRAIQRNL